MNLYDQNDNLVLEVKDDGSLVSGTGVTANVFGGSLAASPSGDTTGVTDTAALQSSMNALNAAGGGVLNIPAGTYWVKKAGTLSQFESTSLDYCLKIPNNVRLVGAGRGITILKLANTQNATVLTNADQLTGGDSTVAASHLTVDGNKANQNGDLTKYGVLFYYMGSVAGVGADVSLEWIEAKNVDGHGISVDGAGATVGPSMLANLYAHDNAGEGFRHYHSIRRSTITDVYAENNGSYGVRIDASEASFLNVYAKNNLAEGIYIRNVTGCSFTNFVATQNQKHGIRVEGLVCSVGSAWRAQNNSLASSGTYHEIYFGPNPVPASYGETNHFTLTGVLAGADANFNGGVGSAGYAIYFDDVVNLVNAVNGVEYGPTVTGQIRQPVALGSLVLTDHPNPSGTWRVLYGVLYAISGLRTKVKAGTHADGDYQTVGDGIIGLDSTRNKIDVRSGALWYGVYPKTVKALAYSASIATDAALGSHFTTAATNGTAFTLTNPTNATAGKEITYDLLNSSGGAMGAITWDTLFKLAGAFTNPANGKRRTISFYYDGTNWVETNRAAADI